MASFKLSEQAKADLTRLYLYGLESFGEAQADRYYDALFDRFEEIAQHPLSYPAVDAIRAGYRRSVCGTDSIYYRFVDHRDDIMAIIGQQDVDHWL